MVNTFGTFQSYYITHLLPHTNTALITLIGGTQCFFILIASFATGRLLDAGHHRFLAVTGGVLTTLGMSMLSLSAGHGRRNQGKYWAIWLTQGLTVGLGMSCMFVHSSQVVATWFPKRRGLAVGITASGASIGMFSRGMSSFVFGISIPISDLDPAGLIYPVLFKFGVAKNGFPSAVRYLAIVVGGTSFIAFFCANPNPTHPLRVPEKWLRSEVWVDKTAFHRHSYSWFVATMCFVFLGFYPIFFNLEDWVQWRHIGVKEDTPRGKGVLPGDGGFRTFYFLSISNGCSTIGRILGAYLSDR